MPNHWIILDVASAPIADAALYIDKDSIKVPENYKKPESISGYVEDEYRSRIAKAGLDLDLARITAIGVHRSVSETPAIAACQTEDEERHALKTLAQLVQEVDRPTLVTYGGFHFDLPLLMRRARYLGVDFPKLNLDRFKSPHVDLLLELSDRDPSRRRSLNFYCTRLGWTDCPKALSGEEEAKVHATGNWEALRASVARDVEVTRRLAAWLGVI
jgi:DNA polymerase elongation subunit (family B)